MDSKLVWELRKKAAKKGLPFAVIICHFMEFLRMVFLI